MRQSLIRQVLILLLLGLGVSACANYGGRSGTAVRGSSSVITINGFYEALAPYGSWVEVEVHGRVWVPSSVEVGWRPYTHGQWVYTAVGWTWLSDWSWGWAPFHYGRWSRDVRHGWVWVPGMVWAPAWVAWRDGDGWLGWSALPPSARWTVGVGLDLGAVDLTVAMAPDWWIFVSDRYFLDPRLRLRIL
ncbi:MAG: hypothetical protein K8J08_01595, partial [Thermoanaerobaculia bacterium]|nr:hypothetical protein [Thermoanaerobaculia bacterium]